ncbi:hypothetical protein H4R18_002892 [Coemansia javaensis]|uniref:Uncharacterized protein n=1 Tax=Coemansia javaensis TaxID=2761396 RepID=A0A9W8HDR8_9FUNG|nr:hypothetical protein H4R18_002892 [Coemansia javaensis]
MDLRVEKAPDGTPQESIPQRSIPQEPTPRVHAPREQPAPADSPYSWVIVAGVALNLMCTLGIANSFGVFSTYYINYIYPDESAAAIAWVGTMMSLFMLGGSVFAGPLTGRFGLRRVVLAGTAVCCVALLGASFTTALWQLVATQGAMFGAGAACILSPSVALPAQWHSRHRILATGIAVAGSGAGGMLVSELTQRLMEGVGHRWTLRALALMLLCVGGASGLLYKQRLPAPQRGVGFAAIAADRRLAIAGAAGLFVNAGYYVLWYYLPTAALGLGQTRQAANRLTVYMNAGSTAGRILAAYTAALAGPINSMIASYAACAALVPVTMLATRHMAGHIVLSAVYGALSANFISIVPIVLADAFGAHAATTAVGISNLWCAVGVLVGNPAQGAIYQRFDRPRASFVATSAWGSAAMLLAACSYAALKAAVVRGTPRSVWAAL